MDVLAVDPSLTKTGLAKVVNGQLVVDRIETETSPTLEGTSVRLGYIVGRTLRFAPERCLSVIEAPYVPKGGKAAGSVPERGALFWMLVNQLLRRGPVVQVRTTSRAMYATSNGRAEKAEVLAAMRAAFPGVRFRDDNEADAAALAAMGSRFLGLPIDGPISKKQVQAMTSTVWPLMKERD